MFCLFHRWGKWSEKKHEEWIVTIITIEKKEKYIRSYQERYCSHCGKYDKKYINDEG